jgi:type I restriction-modification system DNA methylase subunit
LEAYQPLYDRYKLFFDHLNKGHKYKNYELPEYNGGLFFYDEILNNVLIDDEVLEKDSLKLSTYDFSTEIDVNILGHIFEHSISEIEEIAAELEGKQTVKKQTKRKKEGIFYTPKYITLYIVENTIGSLCKGKKEELKILDIGIDESHKKSDDKISKKGEQLYKKLNQYKEWLLTLKILDPACGSGAFLNQALDFLINEHKLNDSLINELTNQPLGLFDTDKAIIENNLYGVDINEESVEIAKLSLWLRTARKGRKLSMLNNNIKCGNSLIDDPEVAGEKAFNWNDEFAEIMKKGGFDVVIGNPPYVFAREKISQIEKQYYNNTFNSSEYQLNTYVLFIEKSLQVIKKAGLLGLIVPNAWLMVNSTSKLRKYLLENSSVKEILNLSGYSFQGVNVETIILLAEKGFCLNREIRIYQNKGINFNLSHTLDQNQFSNNENYEFTIFLDSKSQSLTNKLKKNSIILDKIVQIKAGLKAYQTGKGKPKQTKDIVINRPFDYAYKFDDNTFPYLEGRDIGRYCIKWSGTFLKYGEHLAEPRIYNGEKLILREITGTFPHSIYSTYTNEDYLFNMSNIAIIPAKEEINLKYVLAVLNSSLLAYYFIKNTAKSVRKMFPKIILSDLRKFPFKEITKERQKPFIIEAELMLELFEKLNCESNNFLETLQEEKILKKITKNLHSFYSLSFEEFKKEIKKQQIEFSLGEENNQWRDYFNSTTEKINQIQSNIEKTDKEIDQMVYDLYGLTPEEIEIVENAVLRIF